jgi:hypothetical protein
LYRKASVIIHAPLLEGNKLFGVRLLSRSRPT